MQIAVVIGVGASHGVGGALCRRFAREGLHVFAAGRTQAKLERVAEEVRATGGRVTAVVADVTRAGDVAKLFDAAEAGGGAPSLVVYNAGNATIRPLLETDDALFEQVWRIGCFGGFLSGREAAKRMLPK